MRIKHARTHTQTDRHISLCLCTGSGVTKSLVSLTQEGGPYVVGDTITLRCTFAVSPPTTTISTARLDTSVSGSYVTVYQYDAASNVTTINSKYRQGNITGQLDSDGKSTGGRSVRGIGMKFDRQSERLKDRRQTERQTGRMRQ